ncbi:phosphatase PAP2 family protein [Motilimonas sp. E26]|uniref:phosphatase PAP2 family protein n=1 Tax=Motilimonas TaxID=1914248 RepID=UPI001E38BEF8|nr:phosphatase PAP2 family protein [Motilimonas sp. E26]MCE0558140.1 phosphatase PAP2 family protein [Motilimonas sp. E26]
MKLQQIADLDYALSNYCLAHKFNRQVAFCSKGISHTGDGHFYVVLGLLLLCFEAEFGPSFFKSCLLGFAMQLPVYVLLKRTFKRSRPTNLPCFIRPSDQYSLPSGHSAAAFMMASQLAWFYPLVLSLVFIWASCIALSRVLLGVHFVSDIIAGAGLGMIFAYLSFVLTGAF